MLYFYNKSGGGQLVNITRTRLTISLAGAMGLLTSVPVVQAQQSSEVGLEEIIVTAQRRAESIQDVPIAVSAFSEEDLDRIGATEALDIAKVVPNFLAHNNTGLGSANVYSLRALNNSESIATFDPPVGTYVDDYFIQRQNANNYALFDMNRVEVLRGPQGTLFGRNTTGGAVRMILNEPAAERGGFFELSAGEFDRFGARGSIDLPVSDRFRTKLSAYYVKDDGFVDNLTTGETGLNGEDNKGLRGHFQWDLSDRISWDASVTYIDADHANMLNFEEGGDRFTRTGLTESGTPVAGLVVGSKRNFGLGNETESTHFTSNVTWDMGSYDISFLASYLTLDQDFVLDFFEGPFIGGGFTIANAGEHDQLTAELKVTGSRGDRFDYVAGIFLFDEDNETDLAQIFNLGAIGLAEPPIGLPLIQYDRTMDNGTESYAIYAQGDWHLSDRGTLTVGARFTDEEKDFGIRDNGNPAAGAVLNNADLVAAGVPLKQSESIVTPRLAYNFQVNDDIMWYASATRGFKSGGWNARGTVANTLQPFAPEKVWSYEAGVRTELADNRVRLNVTAFKSDVEDFQLPSAFNDPDTGAITFITRNFADLDIKGLEIELFTAPTDNLTLFANIGLMDTEYANLSPVIIEQQASCRAGGPGCAQGIVDPRGNIAEPVRAPETQTSVGGWYTAQIGAGWTLTPKFNVVRYGDHNISTSGQDVALINPYTVVNGGLTLENENQDWTVTAECKNCSDKNQLVSFLAGFVYLQDPRTWSVSFNKRF